MVMASTCFAADLLTVPGKGRSTRCRLLCLWPTRACWLQADTRPAEHRAGHRQADTTTPHHLSFNETKSITAKFRLGCKDPFAFSVGSQKKISFRSVQSRCGPQNARTPPGYNKLTKTPQRKILSFPRLRYSSADGLMAAKAPGCVRVERTASGYVGGLSALPAC